KSSAFTLRDAIDQLQREGILYQDNPLIYELLVQNIDHSNSLADCFVMLKQMSMLYQGHALFDVVVQNPKRSIELFEAFKTFKEAGLLYQHHPLLWDAVVKNYYYAHTLAVAFMRLHKAGILYQDHSISLCCQAIIEQPDLADNLSKAFASLVNVGLLYRDHPELYQAIRDASSNCYNLATVFINLNAAGLTHQDHPELYQAFIKKHSYTSDGTVEAVIVLEKAGFRYQNHIELFAWLLSSTNYAKSQVAIAFIALLQAKISFSANIDLYTKVADEIAFGNNKPYNTLLFLEEKKLNFPECYTEKTLITHADLMKHVINKLLAAKFSPTLHQNIFRKVISQLNLEKVDPLNILHLVDKLCRSAEVNAADDLAIFDTIIETHTTLHETIEFGPLNKNESTRRIEKLLEKLSDKTVFDKAKWVYENESYYVTLSDNSSYNLTLLIKNANLSHLTLSDSVITSIAALLKGCVVDSAWNETSENPIVKLLPPAEQAAVNIYIMNYYKNINLLFRGEALDTKAEAITNTPSQLISANFLLGCLLNNAVNKLPHLVDELKPFTYAQEEWTELYASKLNDATLSPLERKMVAQEEWLKLYAATLQDSPLVKKTVSQEEWVRVYAPTLHHGTLVRKEALTKEDMTRRQANPWTFPALTSTSHLEDGTGWISRSKTTFTRIEGRGYCINPSEGEILFSHGTQVVTKELQANEFVSKIVCSPTLEPSDSYWSDLALEYAWKNHLKHPYKEGNNIYQEGGIAIHRPNHGLAHTYRMKLKIDLVVTYFANHAKEKNFREFCQQLDNKKLEWLRISAAFCVSGRENETSALEDPERYKRYRQASTDNFNEFARTQKPIDNDKEMIERISDVVLYMGHPDYESKINAAADQTERELRNFYFRILSMAHKLDLARCYTPSEYNDRMQYFKNHSLESSEQTRDMTEIVHYNCALLKAHGNAQSSDITFDGTIIACDEHYRTPFTEVSRSIKRLREVTDTVPRPQIMQPKEAI
ncbi:MAG: hypothetical protein JSS12_02045, partial [Verrucomicrobia bacterium]|nr:hypothetical protein [Verrucomicrobiota bacterium]